MGGLDFEVEEKQNTIVHLCTAIILFWMDMLFLNT